MAISNCGNRIPGNPVSNRNVSPKVNARAIEAGPEHVQAISFAAQGVSQEDLQTHSVSLLFTVIVPQARNMDGIRLLLEGFGYTVRRQSESKSTACFGLGLISFGGSRCFTAGIVKVRRSAD